MKSIFDLESEASWQAYRIANVFLVWKADKPEDKKQAQKIVAQVIKQWYRLGRRHEKVNKKLQKLRSLECGECGCKLKESNWGGYRREYPEDLKKAGIYLCIGLCKKCYYGKYENFKDKRLDEQNKRLADGIGKTYELCNICGGFWDSHVAGGEDHDFLPQSAVEHEKRMNALPKKDGL